MQTQTTTYIKYMKASYSTTDWMALAFQDVVVCGLIGFFLLLFYWAGRLALGMNPPRGAKHWACAGILCFTLAQSIVGFLFMTQIAPEDGFEIRSGASS